jgi:hypothetical protein
VNYDDETLMAYADGELDAALRAEIAAAVERDPALARRVERQRALRTEVAGAFAAVIDQPVPERLVAAAASPAARGKVVQFPKRGTQAPGAPWRAREWFAMAASLVLGVLISWRILAPGDAGLMESGEGALLARGPLANALERQLASDQSRDAPVQIGLTFKDRNGGFCRSFLLRESGTAGLACRAGADWRIEVTTASEVPAGGVRQASSPPPAVLAVIEARIAGEPLDAGGEESARLGGWK